MQKHIPKELQVAAVAYQSLRISRPCTGQSTMTLMNTLKLKYVLPLLLVIAFLMLVHVYIGWPSVGMAWQTFSPVQLAVALFLVFISYGLRAWRIQLFFALKGAKLSSLRMVVYHNFWNNMLPARTGELSFPFMLKQKHGIAVKDSMPALLLFRLLDLYSMGLLLGLMLVWQHPSFIMLVLLAAYLLSPWLLFTGLGRFFQRQTSDAENQPAKGWRSWGQPFLLLLKMTWAKLLAVSTLTFFNWALKLSALMWLLHALVPVQWSLIALASISGELSSVLPVHAPAGLGTYEAAMMAPLLATEWSVPNILAATVAVHMFLLACTVISVILAWLQEWLMPMIAANVPTDSANNS